MGPAGDEPLHALGLGLAGVDVSLGIGGNVVGTDELPHLEASPAQFIHHLAVAPLEDPDLVVRSIAAIAQ
jgi:hypothetical protein